MNLSHVCNRQQGLAFFGLESVCFRPLRVLTFSGLGFKGGLLDEQEKKEPVLMMGVVVGMTYKLGLFFALSKEKFTHQHIARSGLAIVTARKKM